MNDDNKSIAENYLLDYLEYYDKKSISYKKWYSVLVVLDIVISAFIPFATLFIDNFSYTKYIVAFMGSVVTIVSAFKTTFGFHKNWVEYRTTAELLKYHKYLFETQSTPYCEENKGELLILNVNSIVIKENRNWRSFELNNKRSHPKIQ
ncbi:MAG: DUF4231 domain-containing protein [Firmicutes bacterium HGW-Firmicutes-7]|nr:MAG: DUF4231 domain-containing protein [Firmicutes bacterium HGW-Firmicutes-7]